MGEAAELAQMRGGEESEASCFKPGQTWLYFPSQGTGRAERGGGFGTSVGSANQWMGLLWGGGKGRHQR